MRVADCAKFHCTKFHCSKISDGGRWQQIYEPWRAFLLFGRILRASWGAECGWRRPGTSICTSIFTSLNLYLNIYLTQHSPHIPHIPHSTFASTITENIQTFGLMRHGTIAGGLLNVNLLSTRSILLKRKKLSKFFLLVKKKFSHFLSRIRAEKNSNSKIFIAWRFQLNWTFQNNHYYLLISSKNRYFLPIFSWFLQRIVIIARFLLGKANKNLLPPVGISKF